MKRRFFGHRRDSLRATMALAGLLASCGALAQDRAEIDRAQIIGNRELPKVLYIVPWKKPAPGELSGKPPNSVLDDLMSPIDRDVYRRHMNYDRQLAAPATATATAR